jgi:hypothetical protein
MLYRNGRKGEIVSFERKERTEGTISLGIGAAIRQNTGDG